MSSDTSIPAAPDDEPDPLATWLKWAGALLIAALSFLIYLPSLRGAFIVDDDRYVTENSLLASPSGLYRMWFTTDLIDYWPLTYTTFWFEWRVWGANPVGYRLGNILLHVLSALLVWWILQKLRIPGAFLASLLFTLHPVNVESIAWVSQRKEMLSSVLFLLSAAWYLRDEQELAPREAPSTSIQASSQRWYWLSLLAFSLAMLSKSSAAILPPLLLWLVWWQRGQLQKRDLWRAVPFFVIAVLLTLVELRFQRHGDPHPHVPLVERLAASGAIIWFYLSKAYLPIELSLVYPHWNIHLGNLLWWLPLAAILFVTAFLLWRAFAKPTHYTRALLFAWGFFCAALVPVLGFAETGLMTLSQVADHYEHIALIGALALAAAAWSTWRQTAKSTTRWTANAVSIIAISLLTLLTWQRSCLFGSNISLYQATVAKNPGSLAYMHNNLGNALSAAGKSDEALAEYREALQIRPIFAEPHNNIGLMLLMSGQTNEAIEHFQQALAANPKFSSAHNNLGVALAGQDRAAEAIEHFQEAIRLRPNYAEAYSNLGSIYFKLGRPQDAIDQFQQALRFRPNYAEGHYNLANALDAVGWSEVAIDHFRQALQLNPNSPEAYYGLARSLAKTGHPEEAANEAHKALQLARAAGKSELASQIESWLKSNR